MFKFESKIVLWVALLLYWRNDWTCRHLGMVSTKGEAGYSLMASIIPTWGAKMASSNLSSSHINFNPTDSWQPGDCSANVGETVQSSAADTIDLRWELWNSDEQIKMSHEAVWCLCALHAQTEICANCQSPSRNVQTPKYHSHDKEWEQTTLSGGRRALCELQTKVNYLWFVSSEKRKAFLLLFHLFVLIVLQHGGFIN